MTIGYIFIGSLYNGKFNCKIARLNKGIYPCKTPDEISVNFEYRVMSTDGVNIRQKLPDSEKYSKQHYESIPIIGYMSKGAIITILENPVKITTDFWVKIGYVDTPDVDSDGRESII